MLSAAAKNAGARTPEVESLKAEYLASLEEPLRKIAAWRDWTISTDPGEGTGILATYGDRTGVYLTHPLNQTTPASLERTMTLPFGRKIKFSFWVSCHAKGDFELRVFADGQQLLKELIGPPGSGWRQRSVDLTPYAGKTIKLRLEDFPNDWSWEHAYWSDFELKIE